MNHLYSYLAGLIDADGSIYVRIKKNRTHKYDFQIVPCVVIIQHKSKHQYLYSILNKLNYGHIRSRNDNMIELTFSKHNDIIKLLTNIEPFLLIKKNQADLMLEILEEMKKINSAKEFIRLVEKIDKFQDINFSTNRKNNAQMVGNHLKNQGLLTP